MNFQFFVEKLMACDSYKEFIEKNPDSFPASAFFVLDFENLKNPANKSHFDFVISKKEEMWSFQLEEGCKLVPVEAFDKTLKEENKISLECEFEFEKVESLIRNEMTKRNISNKIQTILISMQNKEGKDHLVVTVFLSQFALLKLNINLETMAVEYFEKNSFFDMMKITGKKKD